MKNLDNQLRKIFSEKLADHESVVRPELWDAVQAKLASQAVASGVATAMKAGGAKLWWAAAAAALIGGSIVTAIYVSTDKTARNIPVDTLASPTAENTEVQLAIDNTSATQALELNTGQKENNDAQPDKRGATHFDMRATESDESSVAESEASTDLRTDGISKLNTEKIAIPASHPSEPEMVSQPSGETNVGRDAEDISAKFTSITVSENDLRYFFIPQHQAVSYNWNFGDGHTSEDSSPAHSYDQEGIYTVKAQMQFENGQIAEHQVKVSAFKPAAFKIPNIFTNNGDGLNDLLEIVPLNESTVLKRILIMQDNKKIFESDGSRMWDGTLPDGSQAPVGTYHCRVEAVNKNQTPLIKEAFVTLMRN